MRITATFAAPPVIGPSWAERWEGPEKGLILCWLTGIEKGRADPALAAQALAGELPVLAWKGGTDRPLKTKAKIGSLQYLATWQGLRGENLDIEQGLELHMTCTRTGVTFVYTDDLKRLGQGENTEEERMTTQDIGAMVAIQKRNQNKAIELLLGMVTGIVADQQLHDMEIKLLAHWLADNEYAASVWPGCVIAQRIQDVMADGLVTEEERSHLLETLQQMAVSDFANTGSAAPEVLQLPLQDDGHVDFRDQHICLTGDFIFGTRSTCEKLSTSVGALPVSTVTKKVSYLIVGTNVSPHWAHTSYGRKIEQAMELRHKGHPIRIISERKWHAVMHT